MSSRPRNSRSEEHTSELQSLRHLVCRLLLEKKNKSTSATRQLASHGQPIDHACGAAELSVLHVAHHHLKGQPHGDLVIVYCFFLKRPAPHGTPPFPPPHVFPN